MKIAITGSSGFVGKNIIPYLFSRHSIEHIKLDKLHNVILSPSFCNINCVIHLAGKAHDLKKVSSSDDYYKVNTDLTKDIFDVFLASNAKVFITFSSVKAVADDLIGELSEDTTPNPITHYGKSKLLSEQYILSKSFPNGKRVYILRPCMIHGPGNKGNLNLLYSIVSKGIPWPLGAFDNKRSFCSIDNLCFIINELIENDKIPSGVYNIADDEPISTNELINLISVGLGKKPHIWNVPKLLIKSLSKLGDILSLPLNSERLNKLTETYIVSNNKIKKAINKSLPVTSKDGLTKTFNSFNNA
jgi:nucleoside-diphosphate-sugar epimerase